MITSNEPINPSTPLPHTRFTHGMESHILYQNNLCTVYLLDIPRSIELAQGLPPSIVYRIVSSRPPSSPFPSVEPKSTHARQRFGSLTLKDIMIERQLELALGELRQTHERDWLLERITEENAEIISGEKRVLSLQKYHTGLRTVKTTTFAIESLKLDDQIRYAFYQNIQPTPKQLTSSNKNFYIPPNSTFLLGSIHETIEIFTKKALQFGIITIDPPWPNRSARRKGQYRIANDIQEIQSLLLSIPITSHLSDHGIVAIWITNKPSFRNLVYKIFNQWNLHVIEEWIWLKITTSGEPIFPISSLWRKPYEVLLIGRKVATIDFSNSDMKRRVLVGVPDFHSRKPHLKNLLEKTFRFEPEAYHGLEIFARSLAMGWWSWGDQVLMFQDEYYWVEDNSKPVEFLEP